MMATEADVPEAVSVVKGEGEDRYLISEQFDKNVEQCVPVELTKSKGEPIQHPEMEKPCAVSENVQVESSALVDSKNNGFGISEGEHFLEPLSDIPQPNDQSNQAGLVMAKKTQDANVEVDEQVQVSSYEDDSNKENIPCLEKEAESSQKDVEGEDKADEDSGMYRKEASVLQEATAFQEHEAPISNLDLTNDSFKKDTELETNAHTDTGPTLQEETCPKVTSDIGEDSQQTVQEYELDKETQNLPEDAKTESACENAEVIASTEEERAVQNTREYSQKNEPDLVHSTENNEVFKATTEDQETEEHALPEIQNAEEENPHVPSFKEEEKEADAKCEVTNTTKETESETVDQRIETSKDLDVPIPEEEAYAAESTKACDQNDSSISEESEVKTKEFIPEDHTAVRDYGLVSEEVVAEAESKELVKNNPEEKDSETILIDEKDLKTEEVEVQAAANVDSNDVLERQIPAAEDESEEGGKIDEQVTYTNITSEEKGGDTCVKEAKEKNEEHVKIDEEKALPIISADETSEVELKAEENVSSKENLERQTPTTADEGDKGLKEAEEENKEQITSRDISSEDKSLPTILTDEMAAENEDVELQANENVDSTHNLESQIPSAAEEEESVNSKEENPAATEKGDTCVKEANEEKALATILTDDGAQETENSNSKEQIPKVVDEGETDLKEAESEIKEQVETTDIAPIDKDTEHIDEQAGEISSKEVLDRQIPTVVDEGAPDLKDAEAEIKKEEATDYAPEQKDAETTNISRDKTTPDLEDIQEQEISTKEESLESQTLTEAEGEAENMEQFTSAGNAAEEKGLFTPVLTDEPAKDIEDIQVEEKQFPKEGGEGEEKTSHGNINLDDTSVNVYSTELEEARPEDHHPEKNHTISEEVFDEPKITTRDFSEEQIIEGNAAVITAESVGEDTAKNHRDDEKETENIKDDKCDALKSQVEILEDSQTVDVDESTTRETTTNVEKSEEQLSTLPVKSEESPLVLEKYEPAEEASLQEVEKTDDQEECEETIEETREAKFEITDDTKEVVEDTHIAATEKGDTCVKENDEEKAPATILTDDGAQETENINSKVILDKQIPTTVDEGALDLKEAGTEIKEHVETTNNAPEQRDAETINISRDGTALDLEDIQEHDNSTKEESLESQTPTEAEGETCKKEGEAENMEQFTSAGNAAEEKGLFTPVLSDEPAKDIEDVQAEEKQFPKGGEGEEKASHGNINLDDTSVNVYSTEVEEARPEDHPEKDHTIVEEVLNEPKIISRDFSEEQIVEGNAAVITPESVGEHTIKNDQYDEKETESIKEENASETSRQYIPEEATEQFKDDKCDALKSQVQILEDSQTVDVDESTTCETTNVEKSEEQFSTLPVNSEESPLVLEKLPEQTKPESSVKDAEVLSYTNEETQECLDIDKDTKQSDTSVGEACIEKAELSAEAEKKNIDDHKTEQGGVVESSTEQEKFETSLQEVEKTEGHEECKETIEGTRDAKVETSDGTKEAVEDTHIAALENKDNGATDVQVEDEYFNSNDNFDKQISTIADGEAEQNKSCEEVVDEPNIVGRDFNVTEENVAKPIEGEAVTDYRDEMETEKYNGEESSSTQNITEGDAKDISPEYVRQDSQEKYTDCIEEAFETTGEASNELSTEAEKEETIKESSKEKENIGSSQESEKEVEKEIQGEYTSTESKVDLPEVVSDETGLTEANSENKELVETSHIAHEEKENEGTGVYNTELVGATIVEPSLQAENVEEEAESKLEVAHKSDKSVLDEPKITDREFNKEKLTEGSVVNLATESSVEETVATCQDNENETEKVNNEGSSIENIKEGDDSIIPTEYAPEDSDEKLKECTQEEVESKEEILHESQTYAPEEKIIGSSEVVTESVPDSIAEQTLDEVISKEPSTLLSEEKELGDSEPIKETCETIPVSEPRSIGLVSEEETIEESSKEKENIAPSQTNERHEVCDEAIEAKSDILEDTKEPNPISEEESKKSLDDEDYSSSAQESEKEREKEIEGEYTSTVRNTDSEVLGGETGLKEANTENEDLLESSHIASEEKENEGTGVIDAELVNATTVEASSQAETVEEEAEPKLEVANESEKSDDQPEKKKNNICEEVLDEPKIRDRDFNEEKLTEGSVEEVESKEEILHESQTYAPEEKIIGSSEVIPESVPDSIAEQTTLDEVISKEPSTLLSEEKELADSEHEHKNIEETLLPKEEEPRELTYSETAVEKLGDGETEEPIKETCETVPVSEPRSIGLVSEDEIITDQTHCDGATDTPEEEIKNDSAVKTSDSECTNVVSKEETITQVPVFADEHETQYVDKNIEEEEEVPKEAQVLADEEKPEVISEEPSTLLSEEKKLVDSEPEHKSIVEEQAKDEDVPTEKDTGETEEPTKNTCESVLVSEPRSIGLVSKNEIITDQTHGDGENGLKGSESVQETVDADTIEEDAKDESAVIPKCDSESTDEVSKEENIADEVSAEEKELKAAEDEHDTTSVDKNIAKEEEVSKEAQVPVDEEKPEEKCLQIEEPKDSDLAEQNSDAAETEEEIKRAVETVTDTPLSTARDLDTSELSMEKLDAEHIEEEIKDGPEMVSKSDSGSIEVISSDEIIAETKEQIQAPSSALLPEVTEREAYEPDEETKAQGTNVQECTRELEVSADEHNQASLAAAADSVEEEKCLHKKEPSVDITANEALSNKEVTDTPLEAPAYTSLHEERELEACELYSEKLEGSDVIPQSDSQRSHEVSAERSIEEAAEVTSISRESPEATRILDQGEEHTQVETSEVADEIEVRESQLPEEVKASDNVGPEKLDSDAPEEEIIKETSETVLVSEPESIGAVPDQGIITDETQCDDEKDLKASHETLDAYKTDEQEVKDDSAILVPKCDSVSTDDHVSKDEIIAEQKTVEEDISSREHLQIPSSALLAEETMLKASEHEHETTCVDKSIDEVPCLQTEEAKDPESTLEKLEAGKPEDETKETFEPVTQLESESIKKGPEIVSNIDSGSIKVVSSDEIIAETKEQIQSPSSTLLPEEKEREASEPEDETTPQVINTQDCIKEVEVSPDEEECLQKKEELSEVNVSDLSLETVSKSDFPSAVAVPGEEATADETLTEEVKASELDSEKQDAYKPVEEVKERSEVKDETVVDELQTPSSEKELKASEYEYETPTNDKSKENENLKEVEEPSEVEVTEVEGQTEGVKETLETVTNSDCQSTDAVSKDDTTADQTHGDEIKEAQEKQDAKDATEEVKEVSEVTPRSDSQSVPAKDEEFIADQVLHTPSPALLSEEKELKESDHDYGTAIQNKETEKEPAEEIQVTDVEDTEEPRWLKFSELLAENINAGETEEQTKEASETAPEVSSRSIGEQIPPASLLTEEKSYEDTTITDNAEVKSMNIVEEMSVPNEEQTKEESETTPEVSSRSIGELSTEKIADQIPPPASLLTEEKSYEDTTTADNPEEKSLNVVEEISVPNEEQAKEASETAPEVSSQTISELSTEEIADQIPPAASLLTKERSYEEKSMNVVEEISVPNEETKELNVSDLEFHSSQDTQKNISTEVHAASNEEKNLEVATSDSRSEDCATTTEANEAAKNDISIEEIKDEEELPKDSQLISVDQENIKESQEESEPREERYADERKEQFNTVPSFKDYEVPEVKLDDTPVATEAMEEKSSKSGVETADSKSAPVSLSECLMDEATKDSKEVVTHLPEEKEHADEEEDDHEHVEEAKTDEEKEEDTDQHDNDTSHGYDEPVIVEASRDSEVKVSPKKSHNILSGMGSKVKHSISKVKKAIIGKSSNPKTQ